MSKNFNNKTLSEKISVYIAKSPAKSVLFLILLFNVVFFAIAALIITSLAPETLAARGFWPSLFYTVTMILDAGCISFVVEDVGKTSVAVIIVCILVVIIGMITFTGAVIGYITNYISSFIEKSNDGKRKLKISGHIVMLGWNSRAAEIIKDLIYTESVEDVVVLVREGKEDVEEEINNRINGAIMSENEVLLEELDKQNLGFLQKKIQFNKRRTRKRVSFIVREGDILSKAQLAGISIEKAKTIILLGRDYQTVRKYDEVESEHMKQLRGDSNIIKTLILVAEITGDEDSADDQKIVVEVSDKWTEELAAQVVENKEKLGKSNIVISSVNKNLGQLISQLAIMPELNKVYSELFSNKGRFFASEILHKSKEAEDEVKILGDYIETHSKAIPVSVMGTKEGTVCFYLCSSYRELNTTVGVHAKAPEIVLNKNYEMPKKNVIILGHNSSMNSILHGFELFRREWNRTDGSEILNLAIVDNAEYLQSKNFYKEYSCVSHLISADIYDKKDIYNAITSFAEIHGGKITVLILSDDQVENEHIDEVPLTYLMYMEDMLNKKKAADPKFEADNVNIIIEILDPANYEAIRSYNPNEVIISNQYISHMTTQIGQHEAIHAFYNDVLTFDEIYDLRGASKELYLKEAGEFLKEIPKECTAHELVLGIFRAGPKDNKSVLIGYIRGKEYMLFTGENADVKVKLEADDKLIICSNH